MNQKATTRNTSPSALEILKETIIDCIRDKKGESIVCLNLSAIPEAVTDYFIICDASNPVQVKAISEHIAKKVKEQLNEPAWHIEGLGNMEWVLIDYVDIVVHVFQTHIRQVYQLELLWSDAPLQKYSEA